MKRILLVDDDPAMLFAFRRLSQSLAEVDTAETVENARWLIAHNDYDMVIADLNLSRHDKQEGLEVIREAKLHDASVRTFIWTAYEGPEVEKSVREAGAEHCFIKPIRYETILSFMDDGELPSRL